MARSRSSKIGGANKGRRHGREEGEAQTVEIYGIHAVAAALANPARKIISLEVTANAAKRLEQEIGKRPIAPTQLHPRELAQRLGGDVVHQGAYARAAPLAELDLHGLEDLVAGRDHVLCVVLDQITDPQNVGAILRSAAAFGATALVMTHRHSPPASGTLAKIASGGLEAVPIARVANLARALDALNRCGIQTVGFDSEAELVLGEVDFSSRVAVVLGAEDKGLRRLTRETCDLVCRLETVGKIASLNVSNATAIALHHVANLGCRHCGS